MTFRILIAEDEPFILESLSFLLQREGYEVSSVTDGSSVLEAARSRHPDLLILDVKLPTVSGFDVIRRIRADGPVSHLPVLALTAKGQATDRRKMLDLGANDFVSKPFSNRDLLTRVHNLLANGTAERAEAEGHAGGNDAAGSWDETGRAETEVGKREPR